MLILGNAFSINMLEPGYRGMIRVEEIGLDEARALLQEGFESVVGHETTAKLFGALLEVEVPTNRISVTLKPGARLLVGQYRGPRLEEGATKLPDGASISWHLVEVLG